MVVSLIWWNIALSPTRSVRLLGDKYHEFWVEAILVNVILVAWIAVPLFIRYRKKG